MSFIRQHDSVAGAGIIDALATKDVARQEIKSSPLITHMSADPLDYVVIVSSLSHLPEVGLQL
jgi:ABC-type taurine transport system substrate-binding protein